MELSSVNRTTECECDEQISVLLQIEISVVPTTRTNKLRGLSPRANYLDRETAACLRS
jgi:hypothetical protein